MILDAICARGRARLMRVIRATRYAGEPLIEAATAAADLPRRHAARFFAAIFRLPRCYSAAYYMLIYAAQRARDAQARACHVAAERHMPRLR